MAALTFADHEGFQKSVLWATAGGAAAGLAFHGVATAVSALNVPATMGGYGIAAGGAGVGPLTGLTCALVAGAACGSSAKARLLFLTAGGIAGLLPLLWPTHPVFGLVAAGGILGLLFAHSRRQEGAAGVEVGQSRLGRAAYVAAAVLGALGLVAGRAVADSFAIHGLLDGLLPLPLATAALTAVVGLFVALGSAGAHLIRDPDPVEQLYAALQPELTDDLGALASRAMTNYRRCAELLAGGESGFVHKQLTRALSGVTHRVLELARRWQSIDREMGSLAEGEVGQRLAELRSLRDGSRDETAKKQLGVAEGALMSELQQIDRIKRGRERVVARLHGEMAVLERTRYALLSLKSSDAHLRTAELSALSESLSSVAREMDCEAEAVDEIVSKIVHLGGLGEAASVAPETEVAGEPGAVRPEAEQVKA